MSQFKEDIFKRSDYADAFVKDRELVDIDIVARVLGAANHALDAKGVKDLRFSYSVIEEVDGSEVLALITEPGPPM